MQFLPRDTRHCCNAGCDKPADASLVVTLAEQRQLRFCSEECKEAVLTTMNRGSNKPCVGG